MTHTAERDRRDGGEKSPDLKKIYDDAWKKAYRSYPKSGNDWRDDAEDYADRIAKGAQEKAYEDWYKKRYGKPYCPREF